MLVYMTCGESFKAVDAFHTEIELFVSKLFEHTTYNRYVHGPFILRPNPVRTNDAK